MAEGRLRAAAQYDDWKGSSAADDADQVGPSSWLEKQGHKSPDEFLVGISMFAGENHGEHSDPVFVEFLLISLDGYETVSEKLEASGTPVEVRRVRVEMEVYDFLSLFKRFDVAFSPRGLLDGYEYIYQED